MTRSFARRFGRAELQLSGRPDADKLAPSIGRCLSPGLHVGWKIGLRERASTVQLRCLPGERRSVEDESGTRTGTDLLCSIGR